MVNPIIQKSPENGMAKQISASLGCRSIVLVGMMGAGKSSIGRRLAARLGLPFVDADSEIESAAGMSIAEIFEKHGEPYFRSGEARVIARLLNQGPQILATGGGAIMDARTRELIREKGISIWLKADLDILLRRINRRGGRPLADKISDLLPLREPIYAQSAIIVQSREEPYESIIDEIVAALSSYLSLAGDKEKTL